MIEHRKHPRFRLLNTTARTDEFEAPVLDLSRRGMRIEPPNRLGVDTSLEFEVGDPNHRFNVAGKVRWSQLADGCVGSRRYRSGVQFARLHSAETIGIWARLVAESGEEARPSASIRRDTSAARVPLLTILSPEDGVFTRQEAVTVIGQVRDPGLGTMIEVNGIRALVYGRRFEARVPLNEGPNLVSATVSTALAPVCRSPEVRITRTALTS